MRAVDMNAAAAGSASHPNAVMYGALVASGILPMQPENCRAAIERSGVAVERNLAGFAAGLAIPDVPLDTDDAPGAVYKPTPDAFAAAIDALPRPARRMAGHAAAHLLDYQGPAYVERYIQRLARLAKADDPSSNYRLTELVARRLAAWMAFEDVIRVADLKTRPGRLARIRRELGAADDAPLTVHDFLKPGRDELMGMLPARLGLGMPRAGKPRYGKGLAVKLRTTGPLGWAVLRLLARLKPWRPWTTRFQHEQGMIERWFDSLIAAAAIDYELACNTANLAVWARGYGETRHRGLARLTQLFDNWPQRLANDRVCLGAAVKELLAAAYSDPDTEVA
jgi:indolepyruvate ferredoxin oxidoreductase beta subunit